MGELECCVDRAEESSVCACGIRLYATWSWLVCQHVVAGVCQHVVAGVCQNVVAGVI